MADDPSLRAARSLNPNLSRRRLLQLFSGTAATGAAAVAAHGRVGSSRAATLPYRATVAGLAADGRMTPPPPPPPDNRYVVPGVFYNGDRAGGRIYLTFDDCHILALIPRAMDIAEGAGARLTFFPVGTALAQEPDLWREVLRRGHGIENHTWSHQYFSDISDAAIRDEIAGHVQALRSVAGNDYAAHFLRPPGGAGIFDYQPRIPAIAAEFGLKVCMWSADSNGWRYAPREDPDAIQAIIANVMDDFRPGSIVLQHMLGSDVAVLPYLVDQANRLGLKAVTLASGLR